MKLSYNVLSLINRLHRHMNAEIGTEAAQFPEKEYKNGILVAVKADKFLRFSKALLGVVSRVLEVMCYHKKYSLEGQMITLYFLVQRA